jgi:DNA-binding GntR family transcriptional regulator
MNPMARDVPGSARDVPGSKDVPSDPARKNSSGGRRLKGSAATSAHGSTADIVTNMLREEILGGQLAPSIWLREDELASRLQVSRTPVREAIQRLIAEGLAVGIPNQGARVASLTLEDILAVYAVREPLEGLAARLVAKRPPPETISQLEEIHKQFVKSAESNDAATAATLNRSFHRTISDATNNQHLQRFLTLAENTLRRFGHSTLEISERMSGSIAEHRAILDAIIMGDEEKAEQLAKAHLRQAREARIEAYIRART